MIYAVKKSDFIVNLIVAHAAQVAELETALDAELIDPSKYGLAIGDYWNGENWTRNVNGEQVILEPVEINVTVEDRVTTLERSIAAIEDALCEIDSANAVALASM